MVDVNAQIWRAVSDLAVAWREVPAVKELNHLAPIPLPVETPLQRYLQSCDAGVPEISSFPMHMSRALRLFDAMYPGRKIPYNVNEWPDPSDDEFNKLMAVAGPVEDAHRFSLAWVRAHFPGYPMLKVPQLVRGTHLTTREFTYRVPWLVEDFSAGYQNWDRPILMSDLLGSEGEPLSDAYVAALASIKEVDEWVSFSESRAVLTDSDRDLLASARRELLALVREEVVDAYEPNLAVRRNGYRQDMTDQVVNQMTGPALAHALAFDRLNQKVDLAFSSVLGGLVRGGRPKSVAVEQVIFDEEDPDSVELEVASGGGELYNAGSLVFLDPPITADLVFIESFSLAFQGEQMRQVLRGHVLHSSGLLRGAALS